MKPGASVRTRGSLLVIALILVASACNPLLTDPVSLGGELDIATARYTGPPAAWLEIAVTGAGDDAVFAFALIRTSNLTGPTARDCASGAAVVDCLVNSLDVRMPTQQTVPGDGSAYLRQMTLWPAEKVEVVIVCVDPATQELGCPTVLRASLRTVDDDGVLTGQLAQA